MAKKLIVGHQSALLLYRAAGSGIITKPEEYHAPVGPTDCTTRISSFQESGNVQSLLDTGVLNLVARTRSGHHRIQGCNIHVLPGELPQGSFRSLGNDVLVASPALTLFMLAQVIANPHSMSQLAWCDSFVDELGELGKTVALAEIASELCGLYSICPDGKGGFERHAPLTSIDAMRSYIKNLFKRRHAHLAATAIKAASPLSASPRETQLYLAMTSPWPFGYGLPLPNANHPIVLEGQSLNSDEDCRTIRFSDYYWHKKTLRNGRVRRPTVLEYDSDEFHTASAGLTDRQLADQAERRDQIESAGHGFLRITTEHTRSFEAFDNKMHQLAKLLRIDLPERSLDETEMANRFFNLIFDSRRFKKVDVFQSPYANAALLS